MAKVAAAPEPPDDPPTPTDSVNDADRQMRPMQSFCDIVAALQDSSCGTQGGREEKQGDADSSDGDTSTPDGRKVGFA